jgi:hypothetical protein
MNGFTRAPRRLRPGRLLLLGPILIAAGVSGLGRVEASPIHKIHEFASVDHALYRTWPRYVLGGPSVWSSIPHPPLTRGIEEAIWRNIRTDPSESNPMVKFFLYRESLAPRRFDHYHPRLALALHRIVAATEAREAKSSPVASAPLEAQQLDPEKVPEPGTLLLAIGMVGYALWWRRSRR